MIGQVLVKLKFDFQFDLRPTKSRSVRSPFVGFVSVVATVVCKAPVVVDIC